MAICKYCNEEFNLTSKGRGAKNKAWIIKKLLSFIPINSEKVVVDMINSSKNQIYYKRDVGGEN